MSAELVAILGPAFAAGLLIVLTHVPLGMEVLRRGIIFIDLAIAQLAALGLVLGEHLWHDAPSGFAQALALAFAICGAGFFRLVEKRAPQLQEAVIGCAYVFSASLALLFLAGDPHGGEHMGHMLSGQILFAGWKQLLLHAPVYAAILLLWFFRPGLRDGAWFYMLFALAVTSSVQLAGVFFVFASLIAPALAGGPSLARGYAVALAGLAAGFSAAVATDLPAGPVLVISVMLCAMITFLWRCRRSALRPFN